MRFIIVVLFILFLTGCAATRVADNKPRVFGASTSGMTVQYTDEKGDVVTNKKKEDDKDTSYSSDCDPSCYLFHM